MQETVREREPKQIKRRYHSIDTCNTYIKRMRKCPYCIVGGIGVVPDLLQLPDYEIDKVLRKQENKT